MLVPSATPALSSPSPPCAGSRVEASCPQSFSEHLLNRRAVDSYAPAESVEPLPFAQHLLRSNLEHRAATRALGLGAPHPVALPLPQSSMPHARACTARDGFSMNTWSTSPLTPAQIVLIERVRISYRVISPVLRGAILDVSG